MQALNFRKYSAASDVWSFAAVMFETWSLGCKPFDRYTNAQVIIWSDRFSVRSLLLLSYSYVLLRECKENLINFFFRLWIWLAADIDFLHPQAVLEHSTNSWSDVGKQQNVCLAFKWGHTFSGYKGWNMKFPSTQLTISSSLCRKQSLVWCWCPQVACVPCRSS